MNRPRLLRGLRIAVTAMCGILCVLLIVLWVRSYWRFDTAEGNVAGKQIHILAAQGKLRLDMYTFSRPPRWEWNSSIIEQQEKIGLNPLGADGGVFYMNKFFNLSSSANRTFAWMPFWIPVLLVVTLAGISWLPWSNRFSLRTLLIATTLIAGVLGLAVWASR